MKYDDVSYLVSWFINSYEMQEGRGSHKYIVRVNRDFLLVAMQ